MSKSEDKSKKNVNTHGGSRAGAGRKTIGEKPKITINITIDEEIYLQFKEKYSNFSGSVEKLIVRHLKGLEQGKKLTPLQIATILSRERLKKEWTVEKVAAEAGITINHYKRIEDGKYAPSEEILKILEEVLSISLSKTS